MKNTQVSLDPKDLLVILELSLHHTAVGSWTEAQINNWSSPRTDNWINPRINNWTYAQLADRLSLSVSQAHGAVQRLILAGLLTPQGLRGQVNRKGLLEFLLHGARYVFPAVFGRPTRGIRTGPSSDFFESSHLVKEGEVWVWPSPEGQDWGISLAPIHPSALRAIGEDLELHRSLVNFDALRAGKARERQVAEAYFKKALA